MSTVDATTPARRHLILWLALLVGLVAPAVAFSMAAEAVPVPYGVGTITTQFEIDGNKAANGGVDWDNITSAAATANYTTPEGFQSTGIVDSTNTFDNGSLAAACGAGQDATGMPGSQTINTNPWAPGPA
ncbi:MAG TPA: hypothetical protein VJ978_09865, partial [Nitriliruptoraceae bacterium]|nr:hypothetical protein [Nitriliruptoraceae bacterium]